MPKKDICKKSPARPFLSGWMPALLLGVILLGGLTLRRELAHLPGYTFDVSVNQKWSKSAVELGLSQSYREQIDGNMLPNYPPLSLIVFAGTGWLYRTTVDPTMDIAAPLYDLWIKFPAILFDLLTITALWWLMRKHGERIGLLAAAIYALHPVVWYDSAVWGQTDAFYTLPLLLGLIAFAKDRMTLAGVFLCAGVLMKFQAIAVFPLLLLSITKPRSLLRLALGGCMTASMVALPFFQNDGLSAIADVYSGSIGYYHTISVGAYNFWWSLLGDQSWAMEDSALFLWGINYRIAGFIIFTIIATWIVTSPRLMKKDSERTVEDVLLGGALLSLAFFLFNVQMHERYFFPFIALALPAALRSRRVFVPYLVISLLGFFNLLGVLPWGSIDRMLFATFATIDVAFATTMVVMFVLMAVRFNGRMEEILTAAPSTTSTIP
jgi:Gpi18-like mannosyltransferase